MISQNILLCEKCGGVALVVHADRPLCVECLMARVAQTREQTKMMQEVKPLSFDQLQGITMVQTTPIFR